jgi:hypothetical protein
MNAFAKRLLALVSAAAITVSIIPAVSGAEQLPEAQTWARLAPAEEQLPTLEAADPIAAPLTRLGMAQLLMEGYRTITGVTDEELGEPEMMFLDTEDTDILNAYSLDLVSGRSAGVYEPMEGISRQDYFTACVELLKAVGYPYVYDIELELGDYADGGEILPHAAQPIRALLCLELIGADESGALEPTREITVEEAMALRDALVEFYTGWQENPVEPQRYLGEDVADYALRYVGCRYVRGGQGPKKFDCSGFVYYVYKHFGYDLKPGARNQWSLLSERVSKDDLLPGDLLFFSRSGRASGIFHVGIYIGDGQFVHAANSRKGLIVTDIDDAWYANRYLGAKRVIQ